MARKFLYVVAFLITLAVIVMISFSFFGTKIMQSVMTPRVGFTAPAPLPAGFYESAQGWISKPDGRANDPARWQPQGFPALPATPAPNSAAVLYIHPTSAFDTTKWNAAVTDAAATTQATRFLRLQATALAAAGPVWAPRYRQAVFGAFMGDAPAAKQAIDAAYGDVKVAFETFLKQNPTGPLILSGHSQGTLHLLRLLAEKVGGTDWHGRVVAIYAPGWPISIAHDLPALGFPACTGPRQTGCILSWQSFAPPADVSALDAAYDAAPGFDGQPRNGTLMLCTNPLTRGAPGDGNLNYNLGILVGDGEPLTTQLLRPGGVGARCSGRGILMLTSAPQMGPSVMPGNNYHAYDYSIFWANIRADALERLAAWQTRP